MSKTADKSSLPFFVRGPSLFRPKWLLAISLCSGFACAHLISALPQGLSSANGQTSTGESTALQSLLPETGPLESSLTLSCNDQSRLLVSYVDYQAFTLVEPTALGLIPGKPLIPETWRDMAIIANWERAAELIEALPSEERKLPGARYVLAIAAGQTHHCEVALEALAGLEKDLPLLKSEIRQLRADCQLEIGPFDTAVAFFEAKDTASGLVQAARARFNAGKLDDAHRTVHRALKRIIRRGGSSKRRIRQQAVARQLRANIAIARQKPKDAAKDFRWLATEAATLEAGSHAAEKYEEFSQNKLTKQERLTRASALANDGQLTEALSELAKLTLAPGKSPKEVEIQATRAWAHYHTRANYGTAAQLFEEAAKLDKNQRPRFLYYAAKSHSRSHQDDRAIEEYKALAKAFPGTGYVEQALFRVARLQYGLARFDEAEKGYVSYLERFPGGRYAKGARYDLAISRLALKQRTAKAGKTFANLASRLDSPDQRALMLHLQGVALELAEDQAGAITKYEAVLKQSPVTFAALASSARLRGLGKFAPLRQRLDSKLARDKSPSEAELQLRGKAKLLADWGLHTDAERALFEQRKQLTRSFSGNKWQAMCQLYGTLDRGFRRYSLAFKLMRANHLGQAPGPDNLWAWQCAYPEPYQGIVQEVESRYQLPESLVHAVMRQESGFRPNVVSPVGAVGLMQLMPRTARLAALDITNRPGNLEAPDPSRPKNVRNNVELGGFYLSKLLGMLNAQMPLAVAAYNAGPSAVSRWLQGGDRLPVDIWVARIPYRETRHYVSRVMGNWLAYRYLSNPARLPRLELALVEGTRPDPEAY